MSIAARVELDLGRARQLVGKLAAHEPIEIDAWPSRPATSPFPAARLLGHGDAGRRTVLALPSRAAVGQIDATSEQGRGAPPVCKLDRRIGAMSRFARCRGQFGCGSLRGCIATRSRGRNLNFKPALVRRRCASDRARSVKRLIAVGQVQRQRSAPRIDTCRPVVARAQQPLGGTCQNASSRRPLILAGNGSVTLTASPLACDFDKRHPGQQLAGLGIRQLQPFVQRHAGPRQAHARRAAPASPAARESPARGRADSCWQSHRTRTRQPRRRSAPGTARRMPRGRRACCVVS